MRPNSPPSRDGVAVPRSFLKFIRSPDKPHAQPATIFRDKSHTCRLWGGADGFQVVGTGLLAPRNIFFSAALCVSFAFSALKAFFTAEGRWAETLDS